MILSDDRITTFFAADTLRSNKKWQEWIDTLRAISGPVHLTIDIDSMVESFQLRNSSAWGLSFWQAVETIDALFSAPNAKVIGMDVNEIVPQEGTPLTQFTAAMLATKGW